MEIRSALDEVVNTGYDDGYSQGGSYDRAVKPRRTGRKVLIGFLVAILAFVGLGAFGYKYLVEESAYETTYSGYDGGYDYDSESDIIYDESFDETIALSRTGDQAYSISEGGSDKTLVWDESADSYYDADTDCWLWYNTDVEPAVWQYWYEGISSDFGDYGWMEHDADGWFIEEDYNSWIPLPDGYDQSGLWYIE